MPTAFAKVCAFAMPAVAPACACFCCLIVITPFGSGFASVCPVCRAMLGKGHASVASNTCAALVAACAGRAGLVRCCALRQVMVACLPFAPRMCPASAGKLPDASAEPRAFATGDERNIAPKSCQAKARHMAGLLLWSKGRSVGDSASLHEFAGPVATVHARDGNVATGAWCVNELTIAEINADVIDATTGTAEKYQIAFGQLVACNAFATGGNIAGDARQVDAESGAEYISDKSAAIETLRGGAAPAVGGAKEVECALQHFLDAALRYGRSGGGRVAGGHQIANVGNCSCLEVGNDRFAGCAGIDTLNIGAAGGREIGRGPAGGGEKGSQKGEGCKTDGAMFARCCR